MAESSYWLADIAIIAVLFVGIGQFRSPPRARAGNLVAAFALLCALVSVAVTHTVEHPAIALTSAAVGALVGWAIALRIHMIQIPAMVAFQHGAGGIAVCLVSWVEMTTHAVPPLSPVAEASGFLGLCLGAATFSGSMVASGKLAEVLRQTPVVLPRHNGALVALLTAIVLLAAIAHQGSEAALRIVALLLLGTASAALGVLFSIRVGGADMPVLISFLNATAGLAAALCGIVIGNRLLIACGATVAASGSILTYVMCRAMNRNMVAVLSGIKADRPAGVALSPWDADAGNPNDQPRDLDPLATLIADLRAASSVVIVPGYGMALADAAPEVVRLGELLQEHGATVRYAIHPVAGRMPGHMHVLLAEAEVDYGMLREIDEVNEEFANTDLALVVGACDVVNPSALEATDTPIAGMPILMVHEARRVAVCNLDDQPGYSGVPNPLYRSARTTLVLGDAKATLTAVIDIISAGSSDTNQRPSEVCNS